MDQLKNPYDTPFDGNECTRAARKSIDSDIHKLEERIFTLRRERNRLSPSAILPPEVLSKIFVFTRDATLSDNYYRSQFQWISTVTHICHHWREIALDCPTLWSIPVFTRPDMAQEMMSRSKMAALTITSTTGSWTPKMVEQIENAMTQISRIKALHLSFAAHPEKLRNIFASLSQPAPLLQKVSLFDTSYQPDHSQKGLPDNAFRDVPLLESINLDRLNFSWQAAIFKHQTVTTLQLRNIPDETSTFSQMMEALANMPNLQILHLKSVIPSHNTASGNEGILQLSSLESLSIEAKVPECTQLLRCIQYPPRTKINIYSSSNTFEEWSPLMSLIGQAMRGVQNIQNRVAQAPYCIREAIVRQSHASSVTIELYDKLSDQQPLIAVGERPPSESIVILQLQGPSDYGVFPIPDRLLKDIFDSFDFLALELLHLVLHPGHRQPTVLRECIGSLPQLKHLRVQGCTVPLFNAIEEILEGRETPSPVELPTTSLQTRSSTRRQRLQSIFPPVTVFPSLKTLHIDETEFRENRAPGVMDNLVDMLRQRSDMNAPIDSLRLENCRGIRSLRQRKQLAEVVVDLEIDGEDIDINDLDDVDDSSDDEESDYDDDDYAGYESEDFYEDTFDYDFEDAFGLLPFY